MGLPRDVLRDVIQLTYKDNIKEIDSFELTVNNWDPAINDFSEKASEPSWCPILDLLHKNGHQATSS